MAFRAVPVARKHPRPCRGIPQRPPERDADRLSQPGRTGQLYSRPPLARCTLAAVTFFAADALAITGSSIANSAPGPFEVGLVSSSSTPTSTILELVSAIFNDGSGNVAVDVGVWNEGGTELYFNTVAEFGQPADSFFDIGGGFHDHNEWILRDGDGTYTLTFNAGNSKNNVNASNLYAGVVRKSWTGAQGGSPANLRGECFACSLVSLSVVKLLVWLLVWLFGGGR